MQPRTWVQCFSLFTAVLLLMLYQKNIGYLSQRFRWPTWVLYDYSKLDWSQLDYGLHAKYFHHVTSSLGSTCHAGELPLHKAKRVIARGTPQETTSQPTALKRSLPERTLPDGTPICHNFNYGNGVCRFGPKCTYGHACWRCQGPHPMCPSADDRAQAETTTNWTSKD